MLEFLNQTKAMYDEDSTNYRMCEQAIVAVMGVQKAAKKLAYIHQCIDLYCDREELHDESYWLDYILDPEWIDTDIGWNGDKMTPNQSETPTRSDHIVDISKKVDPIDRQEAIDYCYQLINVEHQQGSDEMNYGQERVNQTETILHHLESMPSVQPERSLRFRIGEICVDESKRFISSGRAVEKIRELLKETERREE